MPDKIKEHTKHPSFISKDNFERPDKVEKEFYNYFGIKDFCGNKGSMMVDGGVALKK